MHLYLHLYIFMSVMHIMSPAVKLQIYIKRCMFQVLKCQISIWFLIFLNKYSFESKLFHFLSATIYTWMLVQEFEDTKGASRIRISKRNRQHNGQKKKYKRTNNDLQNKHIKLKIPWSPLQTGGELRCLGRVGSSCSTSDTRCVNLVTNLVISHE